MYRYRFQNEKKESYGFVIGEGYRLPDAFLMEDKKHVSVYDTLALTVRAVQELAEKVSVIEMRLPA